MTADLAKLERGVHSRLVRRGVLLLVALVLALVAAACAGDDDAADVDDAAAEPAETQTDDAAADAADPAEDEVAGEDDTAVNGVLEDATGPLRISIQPGIAYAPFTIMDELGWVEEAFPNMDVAWEQLASGAAIRDGMIAGDLQVGVAGVGPWLVGHDAGVGWKALSALADHDIWLMAMDENIQSLADFDADSRIAMPAPDSVQSVALRKAAQDELGDALAFEENIVAMPHPDGVASLLGGQITAHLTSAPFQYQLRDEGAHRIVGSWDSFGQHSFVGVMVIEDYYYENEEVMNRFYELVVDAAEFVTNNPEEAAETLSQASGGDPDAETYVGWLQEEGLEFNTVPSQVLAIAEFMAEIELIREAPASIDDLILPTIQGQGAS